jgi:iron complex transport system substrate-binding protein
MKKVNWLSLLFMGVALLLSACGDSTATISPTTAPAAATQAATTAAPTSTRAATTQAATTAVTTTNAATTQAATTAAATTAPATTIPATQAATTSAATTAPATTVTQYPMTIVDNSGVSITIPKKVERIVCLLRDCIDILFDLQLEPAAVSKDFSPIAFNPLFYGDKAKSFVLIGGNGFEPNLEEIAKVKPDLVVGISGFQEGLREPLKNVAPVFLIFPKTWAAALENLKAMGRMVDKAAQAEASANRFMKRLADYKAKSPKNKTVLYGATGDPKTFLISTDKTLICNLIAEVAKCPWQLPANAGPYGAAGLTSYSAEQVLAADPDAIFSLKREGIKTIDNLTQENPVWRELKAVKNKQFFAVDGEIWDNNGGIRSINIILDDLMTNLYPEVFPKALP